MFPPTGPGSGTGGAFPGAMPLGAILNNPALFPQPAARKARAVPGLNRQPRKDGKPTGEELYALLEMQDLQGDSRLREIYTHTRTACLEGRDQVEKSWWQKLLYVNGRQWIYNDGRGWRDKRMARWIPRPVTNIIAETVSSIRAMLSGIEPSARIRPNGPDPRNVITAQMFDDLEPVLNEEHRMQRRWFEADFWAPTLGCCWLHPLWDRDDNTHETFTQAKQCGECGMQVHPLDLNEEDFIGCQQCGAPPAMFVDAVDPTTQEPIGQYETQGCGRTDVVSPLELLIPTFYQRWEDVGELIRLRWRPETYFQGRPYYDQIAFSNNTAETSLEMYRSLALMNDLTTAPFLGSQNAQTRAKGAIEAELWIRPCAEYPLGLWARFVGGKQGSAVIVRDPERGVMPGPLPYETKQGKKLWNWVYYPYEEVGGRIYAKSALDSIMTKQDALNRNDSMVELIMQRMSNPVWLEPKGAEVQRFTGEPGQIVRYQIVAGTQAKPERIDGVTPGQAFFTLREQYLSDVERLAGTQDVLKGSTPSGVEAFSALNLLVERSQSRFTSLFKARGRAYRDWLDLAIELERSYGPETRTRSIAGPNNTWTFKLFQNADLQGATTVIIEDGSETPKTALGRRAMLQEAKGMGLIDPANPDTQYAALELLGGTTLAPGLNAHTKAAQVEQELYLEWVRGGRQGESPLVVQAWNGHAIHIQQLDLWANTDAIRDLVTRDPLCRAEITLHRIEHIVAMQNIFGLPQPSQAQVAAGNTPPGPGGPPPGPGGPAGEPPPVVGAARASMNSDQESGAPDTLPGMAPGGGNMAPPA